MRASGHQLTGERSGRNETRAYLGVRYSEPRIGRDRFLSPGMSIPHEGVLEPIGTLGLSPWQEVGRAHYPTALGNRACTEDILTLNIWRPLTSSPLPVVVWIHGGQLIHGSANWEIYAGDMLARDLNAVVVSIGYRLGLWGWGAGVAGFEVDGASHGNMSLGLQDQQSAIRWIQRNIENYGGDLGRIFLMGHSAGGTCALLHAAQGEGGIAGVIALSPQLHDDRRVDIAEFSSNFLGKAIPSLDKFDPRIMGPQNILVYQCSLEEAWRRETGDRAFERPKLAGGKSLPWSAAGLATSPIPVLGSWVAGEYGPEVGRMYRDRFVEYLSALPGARGVQLVETCFSSSVEASPFDLHLIQIPMVLGIVSPWSASPVWRLIQTKSFIKNRQILLSTIKEMIG